MIKVTNYLKFQKYLDFFEKYPRVQNLAKVNNKYFKLILIRFYLYLVKKNESLKYFFFKKNEQVNNINFDIKDLIDEKSDVFKSLSQNGIIVVQNILQNEELNNIQNYFKEITDNQIVSEWISPEIVDASSIKYKNKKKNVEISFMRKDISFLPTLNKLSQIITKKIFGNIINTSAEFFVHNCKLREENDSVYEDTNFHIDRYLPCLKIIYSPNQISSNEAPFGYIKKTHKLNNQFMQRFILNSKDFILKKNEINEELTQNIAEVVCPANSLIITFTNGLHKRNIFLKEGSRRKTIFFQYTDRFNTFSLLNFKKFNKKNN